MKTLRSALLCLSAFALAAGCATTPSPTPPPAGTTETNVAALDGSAPPAASATLEAKSGSTLTGTATFKKLGSQVSLEVKVSGVAPGTHAVHLHEKGDCSSADGSSAGGHWNPESMQHGQFGHTAFHLGDVGNMEVAADGTGTLTLTTDKWSVGTGGPNDVVGHAMVVHAGVDDFTTQPTGNAGGRIGCGVVKL